ncbi:precorrin-6y C5,15-methyltransferase (decarboxylating) subunit CbiE [Roseospirillum parvum]|uniref:Precorrin-6Y C5,15-methyltransferase (Decarboxylating) n=1 Tax=Roseospirillum parvum TaxID=83401 RepID=A0A1G8EGR9_9PROT|nr:precorrin-6y C5,15-methyltransferase (decarboxylating) subunit CbiE [Roseospirillum parvum]SDH69114.1 precorrin-6Y C5,15-methyltransferase (decarboxylating) [Roseospirillum parvum]
MTDPSTPNAAAPTPWLAVVGIGEDGLPGLSDAARAAVTGAHVVIGGRRHLDLLPADAAQRRLSWPSPFHKAREMILAERPAEPPAAGAPAPVCVLASGDPMHYGIGATLTRWLPLAEMRVFSAPSSFSLAAARLGWALQDVVCFSVHGRAVEGLAVHLHPGARLLVLSDSAETPPRLAAHLAAQGLGASRMTVLEHLGGAEERLLAGRAESWDQPRGADLNVLAIEVAAAGAVPPGSCLAGLPDDAFRHDGQLTKRDMRAMTLGRLAPRPGELLWDVGAGAGSIAIEWMRADPRCRAIAIEAAPERATTINHNKAALGVPGLKVVGGRAPAALNGLEPPDAVFIGGGLTTEGVFEACWQALKPGGRLVANAVTLESEAAVAALNSRFGRHLKADLVRLSVAHGGPLGGFTAWRPAMPVTLFVLTKPRDGGPGGHQDALP